MCTVEIDTDLIIIMAIVELNIYFNIDKLRIYFNIDKLRKFKFYKTHCKQFYKILNKIYQHFVDISRIFLKTKE